MTLKAINKSAVIYGKQAEDTLSNICKPIFENFPITEVLYYRSFLKGRYILLSSNFAPCYKILTSCVTNSTALQSNHQQTLPGKTHYFCWPEQPLDIQLEIYQDYGIRNVLSVHQRKENSVECWTFSLDPDSYLAKNFFLNNTYLLNQIVHYLNQNAKEIIDHNKKDCIASYLDEKLSIENENPTAYGIQMKKFSKNNKLLFPLQINSTEIFLSKRQNECLQHLSRGKSYKQVGKLLGLSPRTVEYYIMNIKTKAGVSDRTKLIDVYLEAMEMTQLAKNWV